MYERRCGMQSYLGIGAVGVVSDLLVLWYFFGILIDWVGYDWVVSLGF